MCQAYFVTAGTVSNLKPVCQTKQSFVIITAGQILQYSFKLLIKIMYNAEIIFF